MVADGASVVKTAAAVGVRRQTVHAWIRAAGAESPSDRMGRLRIRALELVREGMSPSDVAVRLEVGRATVTRWVRDAELQVTARLKQAATDRRLAERAVYAEQKLEEVRKERDKLRKLNAWKAQQIYDLRKGKDGIWFRIARELGFTVAEMMPPAVWRDLLVQGALSVRFDSESLDEADADTVMVLPDEGEGRDHLRMIIGVLEELEEDDTIECRRLRRFSSLLLREIYGSEEDAA